MVSTLFFIDARIDKFDAITITVSNNYYFKDNLSFYLRNNTLHTMMDINIVSVECIEEGMVYHCKIEEIELGYRYEVVNNHGYIVPLEIGAISKDRKFDEYFKYRGHDLGTTYTPLATHFAISAPLASSVILEYSLNNKACTSLMERSDYGVYRTTILGDMEGASYVYLVEHGSSYQRVCDLYAYNATVNHQSSIVVNPQGFNKVIPLEDKIKNPVIYELSVRDFSSDLSVPFDDRGTFSAMYQSDLYSETKSVGFDYLKSLGISHVQLMPIHDFATIEELDNKKTYNWGYDPIHLFVLEGSYCTSNNRVNEFIELVNQYHSNGIGVIIDVVFNHMYDVLYSIFHKTIPHYYYRCDDDLNYSNGSGCSNDINSMSVMVKKYLVDIACRYASILGVDGIRFDLMGLLDISLINEINQKTKEINPNFIIYGEGWDMDTMLSHSDKAIINNHFKTPNVGYFNDFFRNHIKGEDSIEGKNGIMLGSNDFSLFNHNPLPFNQSVNYVACHDNHTLYDYMTLKKVPTDCIDLCNAMVLLTPGIAFLYGGQEFNRSKNNIRNSYNCGDDINGIKWNDIVVNEHHVSFVKELIDIRKRYINSNDVSMELISDTVCCFSVSSLRVYFNRGDFEVVIPINYKHLVSSKDSFYDNHVLKLKEFSVSVFLV